MAKKQIPKEMFDYGRNIEEREYYFYNSAGKKVSVHVENSDRLHPTLRCPRDGVRLIIYSGEPHNVVQCPNCDYQPSMFRYSTKKELDELSRERRKFQEIVGNIENLISLVSNPDHPVKQKNLKDEAMIGK